MATADPYDVVIMGAGPGGYVAGIRAAQLGLKACVIEKDKPGGVCLNWGCIPSKNLIHQAELILSKNELEDIGVRVDTAMLDYGKVHKKSRQATQQLVKGVEFLLKKNKVDLVPGIGRIAGKNKVVLSDGKEITAKNILIATGSRPFTLTGFEFDEKQVLSSTGILSMTKLPESLVILGAGAIGCEFAYVMNAFGVQVILVEMADHILPFEDEEIVAVLAQSFKKKGVEVMTGTRAVSLKKTDKRVTIALETDGNNKKTVTAEKALCVFGRTPNTEDIGLESIGLKTEKGYIPVGDYNETSVPGVFAIGDVVASPLLAHVASKEGEIVVEHMAGHKPEARVDITAIPSAIYCEPQVASFGLRESRAQKDKISYKKAVFPYRGAGKAVAVGKTDGMVKVLYDPETEEILGAHIVGADATEMIHELLLAKTGELLPADVAGMVHAHPTLSESLMESMRAVGGKPIHM
jgi:dihydrolipoamide dehydrogenase